MAALSIKNWLGGTYHQIRSSRKFYNYSKLRDNFSNSSILSGLKGLHSGRRCFVLGNGPSLNKIDLRRLGSEITIGCNGLFLAFERMISPPTYYTVEDVLVAEDRAAELKRIKGCTKIAPLDVKQHLDGGDFVYCNFLRRYAGIPKFGWAFDKRAYWGGTVTFFNLQLAAFLGCNPIILVGIDHNYATDFNIKKEGKVWTSQESDQNHFDPSYFGKGYRWHDPAVHLMEASYRVARAACEARGVSTQNATVGGKLEVFPRVAFESLFEG